MQTPTFIQARNYTPTDNRAISLIVIHTMETPEKVLTARHVAEWFASPKAPKASAHYCIDSRETIQCVAEKDVAWAAPGANSTGIHIEHAGFARQSTAEWADEFSDLTLQRSAIVAASICLRYSLPVVCLSVEDVKAGKKGICSHDTISKAFKKSTHWDPGPNFPWVKYLMLVQKALDSMKAV